MADLRGSRGTRPSLRGPKFFQFDTVLGKLAKSYFGAHPRKIAAPTSGKSWIRHWGTSLNYCCIYFQCLYTCVLSSPDWYKEKDKWKKVMCIKKYHLCNGSPDCDDRSDEAVETCQKHDKVSDDKPNCDDKSDEAVETCQKYDKVSDDKSDCHCWEDKVSDLNHVLRIVGWLATINNVNNCILDPVWGE